MNENKNHAHKENHEHKREEHKNHNHNVHDKKEEKKPLDPLKESERLLADMTDKYLRSLAELENFRKRVGKDKEEFVKYTRGDTARIVLPVLDNLDRAVHATKISDNVESLRKGVELVIKQFEEALKELGVKEIETKGVFNPDFHQVMSKEASDKPEGEILEVYQKGYAVDDKVIRPSLVKVAHKEEKKEEQKEEKPG
jgi:molecular chaperone GrpE